MSFWWPPINYLILVFLVLDFFSTVLDRSPYSLGDHDQAFPFFISTQNLKCIYVVAENKIIKMSYTDCKQRKARSLNIPTLPTALSTVVYLTQLTMLPCTTPACICWCQQFAWYEIQSTKYHHPPPECTPSVETSKTTILTGTLYA